MPKSTRTIHIQCEAPQKPAWAAPCNGCGVCCLLEPCPLGQLIYWRRHGACQALRWHSETLQYRCGAITEPDLVLSNRWPRWCVPILARMLGRWAKRWLAVGIGCDCASVYDSPMPEKNTHDTAI